MKASALELVETSMAIDPADHLPLARMVALENLSRGPYDELLAEAYLALVQAANKFDPARGFTFSTYAMSHIRFTLMNYRTRHGARTSVTVGPSKLTRLYSGRMDSEDRTEARRIRTAMLPAKRIVESNGSEDHARFGEHHAPDDPQALREQEVAQAREDVWILIGKLPERERQVIVWRWLQEESLSEIGRRLHRSKERIRQIEVRAILRMRFFAGLLDRMPRKDECAASLLGQVER